MTTKTTTTKTTTKWEPRHPRIAEASALIERAAALLRDASGLGAGAERVADALRDAEEDLREIERGSDAPPAPPLKVTHDGRVFIATGKTGRHFATRRRTAEYEAGSSRVWAFFDGTVNEDDAGPVGSAR